MNIYIGELGTQYEGGSIISANNDELSVAEAISAFLGDDKYCLYDSIELTEWSNGKMMNYKYISRESFSTFGGKCKKPSTILKAILKQKWREAS